MVCLVTQQLQDSCSELKFGLETRPLTTLPEVPYGKNPSDIMASKTFPKDPISFRFYIPSDASNQADFNNVGGFSASFPAETINPNNPKAASSTRAIPIYCGRGNRESKVQDATRKFQLQYICTTGLKPKGPQPSGSNRLGQITVSAIVPTADNVDGELKFPSKL